MSHSVAQLPTPFVVTAFSAVQQSRDGAAPFLQEANFLWLTHLTEPDWLYVNDGERTYLVSPQRSEQQRLFDGGMSDDAARTMSGVDEVVSPEVWQSRLQQIAVKYTTVYTLGPDPSEDHYDFVSNPAPKKLRTLLKKQGVTVEDVRPVLSKMRACKRAEELKKQRAAIAVTVRAFERVRHQLEAAQYQYEYEIEADMTQIIRASGAEGHAYEPIVASGKNALTLHWCKNTDRLPRHGLVLIDVGARVEGYAADITRTYAIGTPTDRERAVHAAVEAVHRAIIALIAPGVSLAAYSDAVDDIMKDALQTLGLLAHRDDTDTYRKYFPHAISHGLGLDVHESLGGFTEFQPGMVLTVEPGIYIPEEGIGVRIEDDILVTETGNKNLSAGLSTAL